MEDCCGSVGDRELVVAGREAAPLLHVREAALDDVAASVVSGVESRWPAAARAASDAVSGLVGGFGDRRADPAGAQMLASAARRVGLVAADDVGPSARPTARTFDSQLLEQRQQHRRIPRLARSHGDHERQPEPIDERVDLRRQPAAGATDRMVRRLGERIVVVRSIPLCGG